ncbi:MAG: stage II sporulation protein M [Nanoarchaeota archaeon]|nr:stage II sporulation protein M [Nanoarchaeota archaeon]
MVFTILGLFVAVLFFKRSLSLTTIFLITILLIPTLIRLLRIEEKRESRFGLKHFFRNHKDIAEIYLFTFLGVFAGYILLGFFLQSSPVYDDVFQFQNTFLEKQEGLTADLLSGFYQEKPEPSTTSLYGILSNNLVFVMVCFLLSFFYGASAIFLLILNASVFASFILFLIRNLATNWVAEIKIFLFFMIHLIPEVAGFLLAAIAGGVISKAVVKEDRKSEHFKNVVKDATILLLIAFVLIIIGAVLEVYVTTNLFYYFV